MCLGYILLRCATEEKKTAEAVVIETRNGWHTGWMGPGFSNVSEWVKDAKPPSTSLKFNIAAKN